MSIYVEWSRICLDPGRLQRQTLPHVLQWLPWATRHALLAEVRGAGVAQTASAPTGKVGNAGSRSDRAVMGVAAPQHTETPRAAAGGDSEGARSETALIFLSFVLAPAVSLDEENTLTVQSSALHRLEVIVALLLRCASQLNRSNVPAADKGVNDASVWADVVTGAAAASLRLWVRFYCLFFLEQLYTERCRVAVLHATAAHLNPSRSLPSQTPAAAAAAAAATVREPPRNSNSEAAFLRSHPLFRRGHLLHVFALKVQDAVRRCCCGLESGSDVSAAVKEFACVLPARRGAVYKGGLQQRWQARSTGEQRQQRRPPAKHASCGVPRRQATQLRRRLRRRQRSSSSESILSSPSEPSDASSSSSEESENEEEEAAAAKGSATAANHSAAEEDGDIPLAALACQRTQSR